MSRDTDEKAEGSNRTDVTPSLVPPILVALVALGFTLFIAYQNRAGERRSLNEVTAAALTHVTSEIEGRFEEQVQALENIARVWERHADIERRRSEWEFDTQEALDHFPHVQAIGWVDASFRVRWIVPVEGNEAAIGLDLSFEERRRHALELARDHDRVIMTRPVELVQGGLGCLVYVPVHRDGRFDGFISGVYRTQALLDGFLRNISPGFDVRASDSGEELWKRTLGTAPPAWRSRTRLALYDANWEIEIAPGPAVVAALETWLPWLILGGGTINAFFFSLAIHLSRVRRWQTAQQLAANERLLAEMERRKTAEQAEKEAVDELASVVSSFPDHVWSGILAPDGQLIPRYYSDTIGRIASRPAAEFRDEPRLWLEVVHEADRPAVTDAYRALARDRDSLSMEYRIRRPDGEIRWVHDRIQITDKDNQRRLDGVITDITTSKRDEEERLNLESRIQETQKLESLGILAGGIAHDFNNLLVGVLGHAHVALQDLPPDSAVRTSIGRIERAARRAADLCRQLLAYAGKGSLEIEPLDLHDVIEEMGDLLSASRSMNVTIEYDLGERLLPIEADATQLSQLVLNLITNASEAIGERQGSIRITTRLVELEQIALQDLAPNGDLAPGSYIELSVSDDGCGMNEETRRRMFEPFYSTKFPGRGLGMASALGIVGTHKGGLRVTSELGSGTEIAAYFPALPRQGVELPTSASTPVAFRGVGTLLLVDDEEDAREVGGILLERAGFRVITAGDGHEGLALFRRHHEEIGCVLLDLTMPGMDGEQAHRGMCDIAPNVPVILCSGFPEQEATNRFHGPNFAAFLGKPYTPEALLGAVQQVLGRSGESATA